MKRLLTQAKIAIVHDFLTAFGGAERVVLALHELFPTAPIYTLRYSPAKTHQRFSDCDVRPAKLNASILGRSAVLSLPFLPNAVETLPLSDYDIVISSSSAFAKGVITKPTTLHICYCHTPMRYVWDWTHEYAAEQGYERGVKSIGHRLLTHYLRLWDQASALRVDRWVANSANVAERIRKYYRQPATVIHPPVEVRVEHPTTQAPTDRPYFLAVSRLSPYKKLDLAIAACAQLKQPLVIIGEGRDRGRLEQLAQALEAPTVFLGYQDDQTIQQYYQHCQAFLFPGEDDFGITPVEAMAAGRPVIAYGRGGVLETVKPSVTGLFFNEPTVPALTAVLNAFLAGQTEFKTSLIKAQAARFSKAHFMETIERYVATEWANYRG